MFYVNTFTAARALDVMQVEEVALFNDYVAFLILQH